MIHVKQTLLKNCKNNSRNSLKDLEQFCWAWNICVIFYYSFYYSISQKCNISTKHRTQTQIEKDRPSASSFSKNNLIYSKSKGLKTKHEKKFSTTSNISKYAV